MNLADHVNLADQWSLRHVLPEHGGLGVIAKRPIANAVWQYRERPTGVYGDLYWDRLQQLALDPAGLAWDEFALRFSAYAPGVDSVIVGTTKLANLQRNAAMVEHGPLPDDLIAAVDEAWQRAGATWPGDV